MSKQDAVEFEGVVEGMPGGGFYRVRFEGHEAICLCKLSGNMKHFKISVVVGDMVTVAVSPYDLTKGRITFRKKV